MKMASVVSAVLSSLAPSIFAQDGIQNNQTHGAGIGAGVPVVEYRHGMEIDVQKVLHRTDTSQQTGVVPVTLVYEDSEGDVHKVRFLEWGGTTASDAIATPAVDAESDAIAAPALDADTISG